MTGLFKIIGSVVIASLIILLGYLLFAEGEDTRIAAPPPPISQDENAAEIKLSPAANPPQRLQGELVFERLNNVQRQQVSLPLPSDEDGAAWFYSETTDNGSHSVEGYHHSSKPGTVYTASFFAKPQLRRMATFLLRDLANDSAGRITVDLARAEIVEKDGAIEGSGIETLENGWSFVWIAVKLEKPGAASAISLRLNDLTPLYPGYPNHGLVIWYPRISEGDTPPGKP